MRALVVPLLSCGVLFASSVFATSVEPCRQPLYLTFDTGHMGVAPLIADVLARHKVLVTFFAANEKTKEGDGSLVTIGLLGGVIGQKRGMRLHHTPLTTFTGNRM